jgi:predicted MFS family arabinose efflux permease
MFITVVLWIAFFLVNFNIAMMIPLLPFIQQDIGLTSAQTGMVLAVFPITALAGNLAVGPWVDRYGRKRMLTLGALASAVVFLATAAATDVVTLTLCRAAVGATMPLLGASVFAAVADYVRPEDRARVSGYVATAAPVAFLLSMSLGVLLAGYIAWQVAFLLIAAVALTMALCATHLPPAPASSLASGPISGATYRKRLLSLSMSGPTRLLLLAHFCWAAAMFIFLGLYPTWIVQHGLAGRSPGTIGVMLFVGEIGGLVGALYSSRFPKPAAHPLGVPALFGFATALIVLSVPFGHDNPVFQAIAYAGYAFGGSLNAILNAVYQTGATVGVATSSLLYSLSSDFLANAVLSATVFVVSAASLWRITARDPERT